MTILATDIVFLQSERLTDASNGGGQMTGNVIASGTANNLFNDISDLDRTYGRVSTRKAFVAVQNDADDVYLGSHVILTNPPADDNVEVTLFTTKSWTDERDAARNYVENYLNAGPESRWVIYGDQIAGQALLSLYSVATSLNQTVPTTDVSPDVGDVLMLSVEKAGFAANYQYVRVTKLISRETQQFTDTTGAFYKDVIILQIGNALRYTFPGAIPSRIYWPRNSQDASPTVVRRTSVADAARFFAVKRLSASASINDVAIKISSPYAPIVPSAQAETPIVGQSAGLSGINYVVSGDAGSLTASASLSGNSGNNYSASLYLGRGIYPGTLALIVDGVAYKDDGAGNLVLSSGAVGSFTGVVDYAGGAVSFVRTSAWSAYIVAAATPAAVIADNASSLSIAITANNRSNSYVFVCRPNPSPGAVVLYFRALGKWYRMTDDGSGKINADVAGVGSGSINYATGNGLVSFSSLPDIGSAVVVSWATPNRYQQLTEVIAQPQKPALRATLAHAPVDPDSVSITWSGHSATSDANGVISGDATGSVANASGNVVIYPNSLPTSGTDFTISYNQLTNYSDVFTVNADGNGVITVTLAQTPIKPGTVNLQFNISVPRSDLYWVNGQTAFPQTNETISINISDDGAGGFDYDPDGTINYSTGVIVLKTIKNREISKIVGFGLPDGEGSINLPYYAWVGSLTTTITESFTANSTVTAHYAVTGDATTARTQTATLSSLQIDLNTVNSRAIIAGSLLFTAAGDTFIDRNGTLYKEHTVVNDSAVAAGSINYESGIATLTSWTGGASNSLTLQSAVVALNSNYVATVSGRAPSAPLSTGQFQFVCTAADGEELIATANTNGIINSEWVHGSVDWDSGLFDIRFGKYVADSAIPADVKANSGWYDAANIQLNGTIFSPRLVKPETMTFNTVLISYIPLDADILGLDNVRLPIDGRVQAFRKGDVVVIHNTQRSTLENPVVAGATYDMERVRLSYARLYDANDVLIPTALYSTNLDAGTVTMADSLDLTHYVQPLGSEHRILDRSLLADVQVTGDLSLLKRLSHAFTANDTFVSSALIVGDLQARVLLFFDQYTWTNVWSDERIGDIATGTFNDVVYPLVLTNLGAIQERWAIVFSGATVFNCYGEYSGLVGSGDVNTTFTPLNPNTNTPYFTLNPLGWGGGWSAGNVLRFNTAGANYPIWIARTTKQGAESVTTDNFKLEILGNAN